MLFMHSVCVTVSTTQKWQRMLANRKVPVNTQFLS